MISPEDIGRKLGFGTALFVSVSIFWYVYGFVHPPQVVAYEDALLFVAVAYVAYYAVRRLIKHDKSTEIVF
jgi:hypothetical protein